ncbi:hypothetical protein MMPV_002586 [Pyropia vietnamensis]
MARRRRCRVAGVVSLAAAAAAAVAAAVVLAGAALAATAAAGGGGGVGGGGGGGGALRRRAAAMVGDAAGERAAAAADVLAEGAGAAAKNADVGGGGISSWQPTADEWNATDAGRIGGSGGGNSGWVPPPREPPADAIGEALAALTHRGTHARRTRLAALSLLSALCASADDADAVARRGGVASAASTLRIASHRRRGGGAQGGGGGGAEAAAAALTVADCVANTAPAAAEAATAGGAVPALLRLLVPPRGQRGGSSAGRVGGGGPVGVGGLPVPALVPASTSGGSAGACRVSPPGVSPSPETCVSPQRAADSPPSANDAMVRERALLALLALAPCASAREELARRRALALDGIAASVLAVDEATGGGAREVRRALVLMEALVRYDPVVWVGAPLRSQSSSTSSSSSSSWSPAAVAGAGAGGTSGLASMARVREGVVRAMGHADRDVREAAAAALLAIDGV